MRRTLLATAVLALAATRALAQAPPPPPPPPPQAQATLGRDLFGEKEPQEGDEAAAAGTGQPQPPAKEEPDTAAEPPAPVAPAVKIHPDAPTDAYDARVASSFRAAEAFQGPLDGGWRLTADNGSTFELRFTDHAGKVEAVWSDPTRKGALDASGFAEVDEHSPVDIRLHFQPHGADRIAVYLHYESRDTWVGDFTLAHDDVSHSAKLVKTSP